MARREELLISRSRTLRSRRALAASSLRCSSLLWLGAGRVGLRGGVVIGAGAGIDGGMSMVAGSLLAGEGLNCAAEEGRMR